MAGLIGISPPNLTCCPAGTIQAGKRSKLHSLACSAKRPELLESLAQLHATFQFKPLPPGSPSEAKAVPAQVPKTVTSLFKATLSGEGGEVC